MKNVSISSIINDVLSCPGREYYYNKVTKESTWTKVKKTFFCD
jgi:hypothetical protein